MSGRENNVYRLRKTGIQRKLIKEKQRIDRYTICTVQNIKQDIVERPFVASC